MFVHPDDVRKMLSKLEALDGCHDERNDLLESLIFRLRVTTRATT
ncbi:hypothetical protein [Cellulosimicrobium sp. Marseille-Q8652]